MPLHSTITRSRIDLTQAPADRWRLSEEQCETALELLDFYALDLKADPDMIALCAAFLGPHVRADHREELEALSEILRLPYEDVLFGNCYYDIVKAVLGCTAFAIDQPHGPVLARNLDWHSEAEPLAKAALLCDVSGGRAGPFQMVSWPGFIGTFSGLAPGRFAVTMNAVISDEAPQATMPVALKIRSILEEAASYSDAVDQLTTSRLTCDALFLVTGCAPGELCAVERTPRDAAVRAAVDGALALTNNFHLLSPGLRATGSAVQLTSDRRYQRALERLASRPDSEAALFDCLDDPEIRLGSTLQQMVMHAASGHLAVRQTGD